MIKNDLINQFWDDSKYLHLSNYNLFKIIEFDSYREIFEAVCNGTILIEEYHNTSSEKRLNSMTYGYFLDLYIDKKYWKNKGLYEKQPKDVMAYLMLLSDSKSPLIEEEFKRILNER